MDTMTAPTAQQFETLKNAFATAIRYGVAGAAEVRQALLVEYRAGRLTAQAVEDTTDAMMAAAAVKAQVAADAGTAPKPEWWEQLDRTPRPAGTPVVCENTVATGPAFEAGMIVTNAAGQIVRLYVSKAGNFYGKVRGDYGDWEYTKGAMIGARHLTADEARQYGITQEHCVFCATPIKTKESLAAGYGPDCAEKYGLPWGTK